MRYVGRDGSMVTDVSMKHLLKKSFIFQKLVQKLHEDLPVLTEFLNAVHSSFVQVQIYKPLLKLS